MSGRVLERNPETMQYENVLISNETDGRNGGDASTDNFSLGQFEAGW